MADDDGARFVHPIAIGWADCDAAKIVYTGRIPWLSLDAIEAGWRHHLVHGWYTLNFDHNLGTAFVNMNINFHAPVTPRHILECEVELLRLGDTSIRFGVTGRQDGTVCFDGEFTSVFVVSDTFEKAPPPTFVRTKIEHLLPKK